MSVRTRSGSRASTRRTSAAASAALPMTSNPASPSSRARPSRSSPSSSASTTRMRRIVALPGRTLVSDDGGNATMARMPERVLIVGDHESFRAAARALLKADGFEIAGEAADGAGALEACARTRPSIVLLDVQLPDLDGFVVAERLARLQPPPQVVLVSSASVARYRRRL